MTRPSMRTRALMLLVTCWSAPALCGDEKDDPAEQATWLHAKALGRELDGNVAEALTVLRQAAILAPTDEDVSFDLARLSFQTKDARLWEDARNFLALTPSTADGRVLRAYLLAMRGDTEDALRETSAMAGQSSEAEQLQLLLQRQNTEAPPAPTTDNGKLFAARVAAGGEYDTNVLVLPSDANTTRPGGRVNLDAALQWQPIRGDSEFHMNATFRSGTHVNDRPDLAAFDTESLAVLAGGQKRLGDLILYGDVEGTQLFINDFRASFLRQVLADAQVLYEVAPNTRVGVYGNGGPRLFIDGNPTNGFNRNGAIWESGAMANWLQSQAGGFMAQGRVGWQGEYTAGNELRENGLTALALAGYNWRGLTAAALMGYQRRGYAQSSDDRQDNRLIPGARLAYALTEHVSGVGQYTFTQNLSTSSKFAYDRHLASIGVEALW